MIPLAAAALSVISRVAKYWKPAVIGIGVVAAGFYVSHLRARVASEADRADRAEQGLALAREVNEANLVELNRIRTVERESRRALAAVSAAAERQATTVAQMRRKIDATPSDPDCPVAGAATRAALEQLRTAGQANRPDQDGGADPPR